METKINTLALRSKLISPAYWECSQRPERYLVVSGGGYSGKTYFGSSLMLIKALEGKYRKLVALRSDRQSVEYSYVDIAARIMDLGLDDTFKLSFSKNSIVCIPTGSEIIFSYPDDPRLRYWLSGAELVWIDEATTLNESQFRIIDGLLGPEGQILMTFNPVSQCHWIKRKFFDHKARNSYVLTTTYKDNKYTSRDMIDVLEGVKNTSKYYYQVYCLGEWYETERSSLCQKKSTTSASS